MKSLLLLVGVFACSTSAALAQTVLPSGAVAPAGAVAPTGALIAPGAVPGSQPLSTPDVGDDGGSRAARHDKKVPGMTHRDRRQLHKMAKVQP